MYGIGNNYFHELGIKEEVIKKFKKLEEFGKYLFDPNDIYTRYHGFTIKTFDHKIYSIGNNVCQDCGIGSDKSRINRLTQIDMTNINTSINNYVSIISNGSNHILYCINDVVYGNGYNHDDQLVPAIDCNYNDDLRQIKIPIKIDTNLIKDRIIQIECGSAHSLFLTNRGEIFACGSNQDFECGIDNGPVIKTITKLNVKPKLKK